MAKNIGFLVCLLIMALDVVAGILGIEAEMAQNKVNQFGFESKPCINFSFSFWFLIISSFGWS
jgi:hypothetical protein